MGIQNKTDVRRLLQETSQAAFRAMGHTSAQPEQNRQAPATMSYAAIRGTLDTQALKLRYNDKALHQTLRKTIPGHEALFDALEQARCDVRGIQCFPGTAINMIAALDHEIIRTSYDQKPLDSAFLRLGMVIAGGQAITDGPLGNAWDQWIAKQSGRITLQDFMTLASASNCQRTYAEKAQAFILKLRSSATDENTPQDQTQDESDTSPSTEDSPSPDQQDSQPDRREVPPQPSQPSDTGDIENSLRKQEEKPAPASPQKLAGSPETPQTAAGEPMPYKIYTSKFDEVIEASALIATKHQMVKLSSKFQAALKRDGADAARLMNQLQRRLQSRLNLSYEFDQEEGLLDPARLSGLITDPFNTRIYRQMAETRAMDTVVSLLVDNSGSMRGMPIMVATMAAYHLASALERASIKCEVLGFTTSKWTGGRSFEKWTRDGKPPNPGRLNELRHIIYKSAEMPMRRVRNNFAAALEESILKENIDGEALLWAYRRLMGRPETRRILIVVSDGAPIDDATLRHNDPSYLANHLKSAVQAIEDEGLVELAGIGIGHDTARYYKKSIVIQSMENIARTLANHIGQILAPVDGRGRVISRRTARPSLPAMDRV